MTNGTIHAGTEKDTVHRLQAEFADRVSGTTIRSVVRRSRADLSGAPVGALPELVERLARQRLLDPAVG